MFRIEFASPKRLLPSSAAVLLALVTTAAATAQAPSAPATRESWFVTRLQGQPVGYEHYSISTEGAGDSARLVSSLEQLLVMKRLGAEIKMQITSKTWESPDGHLLKLQNNTDVSAMTMSSEATVGATDVTVKQGTGGQSYESKVPYTGELMGPSGARALSLAKLKKVGDKITYQSFAAELNSIAKVTRTVLALESVDLTSGKVDTVKVDEQMEGVPLKTTIWLGSDGETVKTSAGGPALGNIESILTDTNTALAASGGSEISGAVFKNSTALSNIRLPQPRALDRLLLRLTLKNKDFGWPKLDDERQKVLEPAGSGDDLRDSSAALTLEVRRRLPKGTATRPVAMNDANRAYLEPNSYLQCDDAEIKRIATEVAGGESDAFKAAQLLERWVFKNLTNKGFGVGFASASEVCKNRAGDCSEHAVFLAALTRAAGIPSRVAMGLEYLCGMWGGHAWTEVLIGEEWIALDATLGLGSVDAAHLRIMASAMKEGMGKDISTLAQLIGNVDIKVVEYDLNGKTTKVGDKAAPYTVDGSAYQNPWLGVSLTAPKGFTVGDLDGVYPDTTVVSMKGPDGTEVRLRQGHVGGGESAEQAAKAMLGRFGATDAGKVVEVSGKKALSASKGDEYAIALANGLDLWLLTTDGKSAATVFESVRQSFTVR